MAPFSNVPSSLWRPLTTASLTSHPPSPSPPSSIYASGFTAWDMHTATIAGIHLTRYQARTIRQYLYTILVSTSTTLTHLSSLEDSGFPIPTPPTIYAPTTNTTIATTGADLVVALHLKATATLRRMITLPYYPKHGGGLFVNPALYHTEMQRMCDWFSKYHGVPDKDYGREIKVLRTLREWYEEDFLPPVLLLTDVVTGALAATACWVLPKDPGVLESLTKGQRVGQFGGDAGDDDPLPPIKRLDVEVEGEGVDWSAELDEIVRGLRAKDKAFRRRGRADSLERELGQAWAKRFMGLRED
ncbi:hypothetical protein K505DRAFT_338089 [Melanomma pulvis-pyrius CBS 109.77]|uniref:Uncharacterized protein n=1 Tax=Melanomma pulvis-pyrius CBS 109.77 TaxID=1314802 RepID=A0A6A6XA40_9PLEO|nr:hypothetical protein K505DRAFT_338089 [Melanomma pulvis-pyrius CBS 109.77]